MRVFNVLHQILDFVPRSKPVTSHDLQSLQQFIDNSKRLLVITGAGLSTESGIRDYRSEGVGLYANTDRRPVEHQEFIKSEFNRQRYWARNFVGWPKFASFEPNKCHHVLAEMERSGKVHWLVTQNVDALHTKAGSTRLTELHGCTHRVVCLNCSSKMKRWDLQKVFKEYNPHFDAESVEMAPDGDVVLPDEAVKMFKVPGCPKCGGVLKTDVTFFGANVQRSTVDFVFNKLSECDSVFVVGSSLFVFSSYRFALRAKELNLPIAVINIGPTRADHFVNLKISARCGDVLPKINFS